MSSIPRKISFVLLTSEKRKDSKTIRHAAAAVTHIYISILLAECSKPFVFSFLKHAFIHVTRSTCECTYSRHFAFFKLANVLLPIGMCQYSPSVLTPLSPKPDVLTSIPRSINSKSMPHAPLPVTHICGLRLPVHHTVSMELVSLDISLQHRSTLEYLCPSSLLYRIHPLDYVLGRWANVHVILLTRFTPWAASNNPFFAHTYKWYSSRKSRNPRIRDLCFVPYMGVRMGTCGKRACVIQVGLAHLEHILYLRRKKYL
mmetsp:Transcript_10907/g.16625  ORF Transcript_10907/g.16625 Transcript_10907/m.16625 type:complete len:258 (+) Transcript_10907:1384-2157(+)